MRRLCPIVLPVDGLLAHAASTLREAEYALLATLARAPREAADELLLTADRFVHRPSAIPLTELEREHLLDRLGLFGVRLARRADPHGRGADRRRAGRRAEPAQRAGPAAVGAAHASSSSAAGSSRRGRRWPCWSTCCGPTADRRPAELRAAAEELTAGTHEFEEVRLLDAVRSGVVELAAGQAGRAGPAARRQWSRPGRPGWAWRRTTTSSRSGRRPWRALGRWQRVAEHPLSGRPAQLAARTATRTLEGLLAAMP